MTYACISTIRRWSLGTVFLAISELVSAAGFYISEVGTPGSIGTAGAANPTNTFSADAAWSNPAGMTGLEENSILAGMTLVLPRMEFDPAPGTTASGGDGGNTGNVAAI